MNDEPEEVRPSPWIVYPPPPEPPGDQDETGGDETVGLWPWASVAPPTTEVLRDRDEQGGLEETRPWPSGVESPAPPELASGQTAGWEASAQWGQPPAAYHLGADWQTVVVTLALVPFVQSLASTFGSRLAETVNEATRSAVRAFLRRRTAGKRNSSSELGDEPSVQIVVLATAGGTQVVFSEELPPEALAQVPRMKFSELERVGAGRGSVRWFGAWYATTYSPEMISDWVWNDQTTTWERENNLPRLVDPFPADDQPRTD